MTALAELAERLQHAEQLLQHPPPGGEGHPLPGGDAHPPHPVDPHLSAVLAVAQRAMARFEEYITGGLHLSRDKLRLALHRDEHRVIVYLDPSADAADIHAFIHELRRVDARLLAATELLSLLVHLATTWAAAEFAVPALLLSLKANAERILELGQELAENAVPDELGTDDASAASDLS